MTEGSFQTTNNPLDVAIEGNGFLRVGAGTPPAEEPYTRGLPSNDRVHARRRPDDRTPNGFLTTQSGEYVIGRNAGRDRIRNGRHLRPRHGRHLHQDPARLDQHLDRPGRIVSYTDENPASTTYGKRVTAGYLSLATFPNEGGLERLGGSLWARPRTRARRSSARPDTSGFGSTIGGELEMSNVDLATEMTNMITAERGYQANSRVISTADEMLGTLVTMIQ